MLCFVVFRLRADLKTRKTVFNPMIRSVLNSEEISKSGQSIEVKKFLAFLDLRSFSDYSELYRIPKLVELITECAYQQHREAEQHAILALIPHLHNCEYSKCFFSGSHEVSKDPKFIKIQVSRASKIWCADLPF